jgi:hypothetical protein
MNQIAKIFGESGFLHGALHDDSDIGSYLDVVMQDPILWIGREILWKRFIRDEGSNCHRNLCRVAVRKIPQEQCFDCGAAEDRSCFPLAVRQSPIQ